MNKNKIFIFVLVMLYLCGNLLIDHITSQEIPRKEIEEFAEEKGLSYKMQEKGCMLVYGDSERIKTFVKRLAEKCHSTR